MTADSAGSAVLPASQLAELIQSFVKASRAFQMYLPNNPMYQRGIATVNAAFTPIWAATSEIVLQVAETDFVWEEQVVYHQLNKSDSLAWTLFKDGMRVLTLQQGCEQEEIVRFLDAVTRARHLPADAGDDLLTLLWAQEFQHIKYQFAEVFGGGGGDGLGMPEATGTGPSAGGAAAAERQAAVREEAPPKRQGVIDIDDFDSTLYFLDEPEMQYVINGMKDEYRRDVRGASLNVLFDIFESEPVADIRSEIISILDQLFPNMLSTGEFRTVATVLRETRLLANRTAGLDATLQERLLSFEVRLSQPEILRQLMQSLDESGAPAGDVDVSEVLRELRPTALEAIVVGLPTLATEHVRNLLEAAAERLAEQHPAEVIRLLKGGNADVLPGTIALCGRLKLQGAVPGLAETLANPDPAIRLAAVQALTVIGTPGALTALERAIDDADRNVRLAAVRTAATKGYKGALKRVEAVVLGKSAKQLDLTEMMAFFEAYGAIAGAAGAPQMLELLNPSFLKRLRSNGEMRACAAVALGRIRTPEARQALERAAQDKDLVVRNAAQRALRGTPA